MPRSKRSKVVSLTKTDKRPGRENNERLYGKIRESIDEHQIVFVFSVDNMRNTHLKEVRTDFSDSRIFFGKTKVMAKALGTSASDEYRLNLSSLSKHLTGNVGLLITSRPAEEVLTYFESFSKQDYARMNAVSPITFIVPAGVVYSSGGSLQQEEDVPMAHSLETTVRGLGMPTRLVNGKVHLDQEFVVCKEGKKLDSKQATLLKIFGIPTAEFVIRPSAYWTSATMQVTAVGAMEE
ncbi:unnamed protein product [Tuber melanosporum]|jgi:mRNA turnover protein 4|uniref:Ribosome assembly factor mrt4 n=1 Tax=Tuber melanosporum (strain Mel28) TaxID=656061 RepID=D5GJQ5_TUBMM|nr:mRNA turnover protein MRT4 [Tuber melanosporum]CAZ84748.1 unnamed protein product [Tuber melanosporum]